MKQVELEKLVEFAKTLQGDTLRTAVQKRPFTVKVTPRGFQYTPASSGKTRLNDYRTIEKVLAQFHQIQRYEPGLYADVTRNASYLMAILELYFERL